MGLVAATTGVGVPDAGAARVAVGGGSVAVRAAVAAGELTALGEARAATGLGVASRPGSSPQAVTRIKENGSSRRIGEF